jgi:PAS domain S-box-containing protein
MLAAGPSDETGLTDFVLNALPGAVLLFRDQAVSFASDGLMRLLGYEAGMIADEADWWGMAFPNVLRRRQLQEAWAQHPGELRECRIRCRDGSFRDVLVTYYTTPAQQLFYAVDNSAKRNIEDALWKSESSFSRLIESAPLAVVAVRDERIIYANGKAARMFGFASPEGMAGELAGQLADPGDSAAFQRKARYRSTTAQDEQAEEITCRTVQGARFPALLSSSGVVLADGAAAVLFLQDMSELKRMQGELLKAERLSTIGSMASGIVHDIRNPLTSIRAFAELLGDFEFSAAERREYADLITHEVQRLSLMAEDLLEFSSGRRVPCDIAAVPVAPLLEEFSLLLARYLEGRGVSFESRVTLDAPLLADRNKLMRVMLNLATNARDAMTGGGVLTLSVTREADQAHLAFTDTGQGIPEEIRDTLFEPFVTHGKKNGTGLGTAICKRIVEEMQGRIWFETVTGQGTTFHVTLPLATSG